MLFAALSVACSDPGAATASDAGADVADVDPCGASTSSSQQAIMAGTLDDADHAVVAVNSLQIECMRGGAPHCTGTLIAPDVVITAAHCVRDTAPEFLGVLLGPTSNAGTGTVGKGLEGSFFRVRAMRVHPSFDPSTLANDAALLRLDGAASVTPALRSTRALDASLVGATLRVVGYGAAERDAGFPDRKREGTVRVTSVDATQLAFAPAPSMTCSGDSGGPVFAKFDGVEYLVGITSRGDAACVERSVATRVDALGGAFFNDEW